MNSKIIEFLAEEQQKITELEKDIKVLKLAKDNHLKEGLMSNYEKLLEVATIIDKHGHLEKIAFSMTYDEYKKIILNTSGPKKTFIKLLERNVSMTGTKFNDADSYATFVSSVIGRKNSYKKFDAERKEARRNNRNLLFLPNVEDDYFTHKLVDEPTNKLLTTIDYVLLLLEKKKNLATNSVNIMREFSYLDSGLDYELCKEKLNEFSKLIKKNISVADVSYDKLKLYLIEELKKHANTQENKTEVVYVDESFYQKTGKREDRKKEHKLKRLNNEISIARKSMSSESKTWTDILVDQILIFDNEQLQLFINNPNSYVPSDIDDIDAIVDLTAKELERKDVDIEVINALKKVKNK